MSVWKDARELGTAAGEAADPLCADPDLAKLSGTAPFTTPGGVDVTSILLTPIPITQDNLDVVLDADWIDEDTLCQGVDAGLGRRLRLIARPSLGERAPRRPRRRGHVASHGDGSRHEA